MNDYYLVSYIMGCFSSSNNQHQSNSGNNALIVEKKTIVDNSHSLFMLSDNNAAEKPAINNPAERIEPFDGKVQLIIKNQRDKEKPEK